MKHSWEVYIRTALATALLIIMGFCIFQLYFIQERTRVLKVEKVELQHIKYGLFNVDEWKTIAAQIITEKVNAFEVTPENEKELQKRTEKILREVINQAELLLKEENKKEGIKGFFRQTVSDFVVPFDKIRARIPEFSLTIIHALNDPKNKEELKSLIIKKINAFADETIGTMDYTLQQRIIDKYQVSSADEALNRILQLHEFEKNIAAKISALLFIAVLIAFGACIVPGAFRGELALYSVSAYLLLFGGISLPMIDIEATISHFEFLLMGEEVLFENQIVFFQSKSILNVIVLLVEKGDPALVLVALLIGMFSVIFPLVKLSLSALAQFRGEIPRGKVAQFFIFKSGKWSMADVMVLALFMAYLGFGGVINSQLTQLENNSGSLEVFTTNNSKLQLGFFIFTAYTILSLLISQQLQKALKPLEKLD